MYAPPILLLYIYVTKISEYGHNYTSSPALDPRWSLRWALASTISPALPCIRLYHETSTDDSNPQRHSPDDRYATAYKLYTILYQKLQKSSLSTNQSFEHQMQCGSKSSTKSQSSRAWHRWLDQSLEQHGYQGGISDEGPIGPNNVEASSSGRRAHGFCVRRKQVFQ